MKKIFLTLFAILYLSALKGFCVGMVVQNLGTTITDSGVTQNLNMVFDALGSTNITLSALDNYVINQNNSNINIPVSNVFINCNSSKYQLLYQIPTQIFSTNTNFNGIIQSAFLTIENVGPLPFGTYHMNLKFTCTNNIGSYDFIYPFTFNVAEALTLESAASVVQITLSENNVFQKEVYIKNTSNTQINIKANEAWKLYLDTTGITTLPARYYAQIKTKANITTYQSERFEIRPNQRYSLASGDCTILNPPSGQYIPTYLTIEYSLMNDQDNYVTAGVTNSPIKYSLEAN